MSSVFLRLTPDVQGAVNTKVVPGVTSETIPVEIHMNLRLLHLIPGSADHHYLDNASAASDASEQSFGLQTLQLVPVYQSPVSVKQHGSLNDMAKRVSNAPGILFLRLTPGQQHVISSRI
jgi:hypothetical protein